MSYIKVSDLSELKLAGSDFFTDAEGLLTELQSPEISEINGGGYGGGGGGGQIFFSGGGGKKSKGGSNVFYTNGGGTPYYR